MIERPKEINLHVKLPDELSHRVDVYQAIQRLPNKTAAVVELLRKALIGFAEVPNAR